MTKSNFRAWHNFIFVICVCVLLSGLAPAYASASENEGRNADARRSIYASTAPVYALAEGLLRGIDGFQLEQLVQPQLDCVRLYELSEWDLLQLSNADACIIWDAELESFGGALMSAGAFTIVISDFAVEYGAPDAALNDYDYFEHYSGVNPHSYMSIHGMSKALDKLHESIAAAYPDIAEKLHVNYQNMRALMDAAINQLEALPVAASSSGIAVMYEGLPYALAELGLEWFYLYPREPAAPLSGRDLDEMLRRLQASGASTVAAEKQMPAELKASIKAAGYELRCVSTLMTLHRPTLEEYLAVQLENTRILTAGVQ